MDELKEKVEKLVKKIKSDKDFEKKFKADPIKAVEDVLGVDLPDDKIQSVIDAVKAKITVDNAKDVADSLKKLFK